MYASITTWTLHPSVRESDAVFKVLQDLVRTKVEIARSVGMVDSVLIYLEPETVVGISVYESEEDALAAAPIAREAIEASFTGSLRVERREVGPVYDVSPPHSVHHDHPWRHESEAMYATLSTWRMTPELQAPGAFDRFLVDGNRTYFPVLRRMGVLDAMFIPHGEDQLAVLDLYGDPIEGHAVYEEAVAALAEYIDGKLEPQEVRTGRAYDIPLLLGDRG